MRIINSTVLTFLIIIISACGSFSDSEISETGFIVYRDSEFWYFVIGKSTNYESCLEAFKTENLGKGYQFTPHSEDKIKAVESSAQVFRVENVGPEFAEKYHTIKIAPARIKFKITDLKTKRLVNAQPEFIVKINGRFIRFKYDFVEVEIKELYPLRCN